MARVVVVGSGVGGLATAIRLRAMDHEVSIFERGNHVGGKLGATHIDGFTFDTGPSLLTLPEVFRDLFSVAGSSLDDFVSLVRLDHTFRHHFDGEVLDTFNDGGKTRDSFGAFAARGADDWNAMRQHSASVWNVAERTFFSGPIESPLALARRMWSPWDLARIDAFRTLSSRSRSLFHDARLQAWMNRFATYSGSSPFEAPATLSCIPHVEQKYGAWHVRGGLGRFATSLSKLAIQCGIAVHTNTPATRLVARADRIVGVRFGNHEVAADIVVCNVNAENLYADLLPNSSRLTRAARAGRSSSVFAMMLGVSGRSDDVVHHNVWYTRDQRREFEAIFHGSGVPNDPTIYVCNPSVTDSSLAPDGYESWFILVNVAAGACTDWQAYGRGIIDRLGIASRVRIHEQLTPADLETRFGDPGGAIYGTSSNSKRSSFFRASNRGPVQGLYLCGGSSHPGGGLPLAAMSGKIVADMVAQDLRR